MASPFLTDFSSYANIPLWLLAIVVIWSLIWKGLALWKAAKKDSKPWFVALLVINTMGILEILYLYLFSEIKMEKHDSASKISQGKIVPKNKKRRR